MYKIRIAARTRTVLELGALAGFCLSVLLTAAFVRYNAACDAVCDDTLRLHIIANSDSINDQRIKFEVRDALLEAVAALTTDAGGKDEAVEALRQAMPVLQRQAEQAVRAARSGQTVALRLEEADFAPKDYGSFRLPAGRYTALRVELGAAAGRNWFCVLYPNLCVGSCEASYPTEAENAVVFNGYEVHFALLDGARSLWQKIRG